VIGITADRVRVSEFVPMAANEQWRNAYKTALRACGNKRHQEREADIAILACVQSLSQVFRGKNRELTEIRTALADLRLLKVLYGKYAGCKPRPG
jgi:hypothetical protein